MTRTLDPALLRRARLAELNYVRREVTQEVEATLARARGAMVELQTEIQKSRQLTRR